MKLIVGLGNPGKENLKQKVGKEYEKTRHNMGFMFIDDYAKKKNVEITKKKFQGLYVEFINNGEKTILLKPQSYINLSGEVVKSFVDFYKINIEDILIINDDLDLPIGKYKLRPTGSSGGHNGLKNIEAHLHTQDYKRLKIGISNNKEMDTKDYVLGDISKENQKIIDELKDTVNNIIDDFYKLDFEALMAKYNHK